MRELLRERKDIYWLLAWPLLGAFYFVCKLFISSYHIVHFSFDDKIPFLPAFVLPYVLWYLYVPGLMILTFLNNKDAFKRQQFAFYTGAIICSLVFVIYPTMIDFRPDASGKGLFLWMVRITYSNDTPAANVFPSLHCYEALSVHLTTFTVEPFKKKVIWRTVSAISVLLICLSTVFIKQHSFVDVISGCLMAVVSWLFINILFGGNKNGTENKTV